MNERSNEPVRATTADDETVPRPVYVVWELTLKCDQPCTHCGSRAGPARATELSTAQALDVAAQLVAMGTREVTFIGGEAYLRPDLCEIALFLSSRGVRVTMQSGGRALSTDRLAALREAGLSAIGISLDGPSRVHDRLRGNLGSHHAAVLSMERVRAAGLLVTANTQINRLNADHLWEVAETLLEKGVTAWEVSITVPMGRAADHPEWILEPHRVIDVIDTLAAIQLGAVTRGHRSFDVHASNNLGYFGPHEHVLRSQPGGAETHYSGCTAGKYTLGIESDGTVKGCPSLPTGPYAAGRTTETSIAALWESSAELRFTRDRDRSELWGFCKTCYYADTCMAGCSWVAHAVLGRRGNNPFCYHRAVTLRKKGIAEKLQLVARAPGAPYDLARFELVEEPLEAR